MIHFTIYIMLLLAWRAAAQNEIAQTDSVRFPWPGGKRAALSLSFDDARKSQIETGIPLLNHYGVKATFYVSPDLFIEQIEQWRAALAAGHEIGNHTLSHPCTGNYAFSRDNALELYSLERIEQDIDNANRVISENLGIQPASFAYPCGQSFVGRGSALQSYVPLVAEKFRSGRGWLGEAANDPWICDLSLLLAMESDEKTFEYLRGLVDKAAAEGRWLILAGHEIGEENHQTTLTSVLDKLCSYVQDPAAGIWVETVGAVATFVHSVRAAQKLNKPGD